MCFGEKRVEQEVYQGDALVEGCRRRARGYGGGVCAGEDVGHLVVVLVLAEEVQVEREVLRDFGILEILGDKLPIDADALVTVGDDHATEVLPAARRDHASPVDAGAHLVEVFGLAGEIGGDGWVHAMGRGVVHPDAEVGLHVDALHAVHHRGIEITGRAVVLRWVTGRDDDPADGQTVLAEGLVLQELQHGRGQRLRGAVDLIEEEYALAHARPLDGVVGGGDDLAHGIAADLVAVTAELVLGDVGEPQGALARVMRDGI